MKTRLAQYLNNLGVAYSELGDFARAEETFRRVVKAKPAYAEGHFNLGKVLHKQGRFADSLAAYQRAYAMEPEFLGLRFSLATLHRLRGRTDRAIEVLDETPGGVDKASVLLYADCIAELRGAQAAFDWIEETLRRQPSWRVLRGHRGFLHLACGHWREGWREYYQRDEEAKAPPVAPLPASLAGRQVLRGWDQGLGDFRVFQRFVPALRERGAEVHFLCLPALLPLLRPLPLFKRVFAEEQAVDEVVYDHRLLISDLPAAMEADSAPPSILLAPDARAVERLRERLRALGPAPYLGITWRAGTDTRRNREFGVKQEVLSKEIPLEDLAAALRGWRGTLLCLQRNPYADEIEKFAATAGAPLHDLSALNGDLVEMLALQSVIDEYVAVSNTNVHLRASAGRTSRVVVPQPPEWRWMLEGETSPWFPGCSLYRQPASRDWSAPLARLKEDLLR